MPQPAQCQRAGLRSRVAVLHHSFLVPFAGDSGTIVAAPRRAIIGCVPPTRPANQSRMNDPIIIRPVQTKADRKAFVDFAWEVYKRDPAWVPPLKDEVHGLLDPKQNPWFGHGRAAAVAGAARRQDRRADQRPGRRSGADPHGTRHRPVGHVRSARRRSRRRPDRHRRGLAAGTGHDSRAGSHLHFDLGRAGTVDRGFRAIADGDDGPSSARISPVGSRPRAIARPRTF